MEKYEKGYKELNRKKINYDTIFLALFAGMVLMTAIEMLAKVTAGL